MSAPCTEGWPDAQGRASSLLAYVRRRCGRGSIGTILGRSVYRAFTAPTLAGFWQFWNPVYGYILARYCYRPLRRCLPRGISMLVTFAVSGFALHDLLLWPTRIASGIRPCFPVVTVAFVMLALATSAAEALKVDMRALSRAVRLLVHGGVIAIAFGASMGISRLV